MKTKPADSTTLDPAVASSSANVTGQRAANATATPWRPPTRRWFLGAVAVAAAAVAVVKPKPAEVLPTRWIGHC